MSHVLRYAARTDRGLLRANNQDSVFAGDRLLVIADGMGGHAAGDVASRLVVAAFVDLDELPLGSDMVRPLTDATREGNSAIAEMVGDNPELDGMGTTLTALLFDGPVVALAHVGDSRAYLYRNGVLHQISHDDTFVQSLVDDGRITADEAAHHPQRSLLLRALNGSEMDPSITLRETSPGDRFLICSDGLSDVVSPESIADALAGPDPDQVADTLIQLALVGGGPDNVTVIVADVVETGDGGGFGIGGGIDPEATGPMQPIHLTQKMPRVPLPPIPEDPPAKPEYAPRDDVEDDEEYDDSFDDDVDHPDGDVVEEADDDEPGRPAARTVLTAPPTLGWHRRWALALALAVLVGVALTGSYLWANTKYYVGDNDDQVTVFRGVNGTLLGWKLASAQENSCAVGGSGCTPLKVRDLVQAARDQVTAGIPVGTLADARAVVIRLTSQQLPPCPPGGAVPTTAVPTTAVPTTAGPTAAGPTTAGPTAVLTTAALTTAVLTTAGPTTSNLADGTGMAPVATTTDPKTTPLTTTPLTTPPTSTPPTSKALTTRIPTTKAPTTKAPTSKAATTKAPTTKAPTTKAPTSSAPNPPATTALAPVTTTVTITVPARSDVSAQASSAQRLRQVAPATNADPSTPRPITPGPITRPRESAAAPTVTVFTTVTSTPPTSVPASSGTPLVSPAALPGVTCRVVS